MKGLGWGLLQAASRCLDPEEREAVLGDLVEAGESDWLMLREVSGLVIRRQMHWRSWLAACVLALPCSLLLMGFSLSVSQAYQKLLDPAGLTAGWLLFCNILLLGGWAWTGAFVVGPLSRRTAWVSVALSFLPCLFCLARFNVECVSRLCLGLFLLPAVWALQQGWRFIQIRRSAAVLLALGVTALTIPTWGSTGAWIPNWALSWPAWYLVAAGRRSG